jgi:hypothetical protein
LTEGTWTARIPIVAARGLETSAGQVVNGTSDYRIVSARSFRGVCDEAFDKMPHRGLHHSSPRFDNFFDNWPF